MSQWTRFSRQATFLVCLRQLETACSGMLRAECELRSDQSEGLCPICTLCAFGNFSQCAELCFRKPMESIGGARWCKHKFMHFLLKQCCGVIPKVPVGWILGRQSNAEYFSTTSWSFGRWETKRELWDCLIDWWRYCNLLSLHVQVQLSFAISPNVSIWSKDWSVWHDL